MPEHGPDPDDFDDVPLFFEFECDDEGATLTTNMTDEQVVTMLVGRFLQRNTAGQVH